MITGRGMVPILGTPPEEIIGSMRAAYHGSKPRWDEQERASMHTGLEAAYQAVLDKITQAGGMIVSRVLLNRLLTTFENCDCPHEPCGADHTVFDELRDLLLTDLPARPEKEQIADTVAQAAAALGQVADALNQEGS